MTERSQNHHRGDNPHQEKFEAYLRDLIAEKAQIDEAKFPHAYRLIDEEIQKTQASGRVPYRESKFLDVYNERPVKVTVKVAVPIREHPRYNFVGKILGPKGNNLKQLQEETMCHIAVCGRGSIRDKQKEEELRQSLEPKYAHLHDDLHMDINTLGSPAEAHARIAFALAEVRKYLIPEYSEGGHVPFEMTTRPIRNEHMEGGHSRKPHGGIMKNRHRAPVEEYDEEYEDNEEEYEEYVPRGRPSGPSRGSYGGYGRQEYQHQPNYYRENAGGYGSSGSQYGYKKRKTFME